LLRIKYQEIFLKKQIEGKMKKILGLDLGTNSIGAAILSFPEKFEDYGKEGKIEWLTSRIVPFDEDYSKAFLEGKNGSPKVKTPAANRRQLRGSRRLKYRYKLRRTKLIKLFKLLGWLPEDFPLDNPKRIKDIIAEYGKFNFRISDYVPVSDESYREFYKYFGYSEEQLNEIIEEIKFRRIHNGNKRNEEIKLLPEDWIVYYLRKKGLTQKLTTEELIRILYLFNQRRGFQSNRLDLKENETTIVNYEEFKEKFKELRRNENGKMIAKVKEKYKNQNFETKFVSITRVINIEELTEEGEKAEKKFRIYLEDNRIEAYEIERKEKPDWLNKEYTFVVTQKIEKNKFKQNIPKTPEENEWIYCTTALDEKMGNKYPGEYFFDELVNAHIEKREYKIRQYPVYRHRYQKELETIWKKQCELNPELAQLNINQDILKKLAEVFYPSQSKFNGPKIKEFLNNDLLHVISNDIIYYQRDLKSQKNSIGECRYEKRKGIDGETYGLKCIPKSSPLFQEFRIWQDIHNIRLIRKEHINPDGKKILDIEETSLYINDELKEKLFDLFNSKEEIKEKDILLVINQYHKDIKPIQIGKKDEEHSHYINLFRTRKTLKGNETKHRYRKIFKELDFNGDYILNNNDLLMKLWHADYSNSNTDEKKSFKGILSALGWKSENEKNKNWNVFQLSFEDAESIAELIVKLPAFKKEYGSYSALAIRKMLIFMRTGEYWKHPQDIINQIQNEIKNGTVNKDTKEKEKFLQSLENALDKADKTYERLKSINFDERKIQDVDDDEIPKQLLKSFIKKRSYEEFIKGLNTYQAGYLLYGKHSEQEIIQVNSPEEYSAYIQKTLKPGSLRNPIVELVVRETCALVKDVWKKFGQIDEIHIELARELKHNKEERARISEIQNENLEEKQRIKEILYELLNYESFEHYDENGSRIISGFTIKPNPENLEDIKRFRLWKEQASLSDKEWDKKIKEEKIPTQEQIKKYILWLGQNCRSPYTGKIIPISKLFDGNEYEVDHIIPRSKMKNDAMNNLVIVESRVNKAKGNELAANFIANRNGYCEYEGKKIDLLKYEDYKKLVDDIFRNNRAKRKNLLATEVPDDFIERQINDTRYISKKLGEVLRPVLKDPYAVIFTIGSITSELRNNWSLNEIWKDLLKPRFERLEKILDKQLIIKETNSNKFYFDLSFNEKLEKDGIKRLDHRHHALDAIVIAATTREHIRYLNTLNAADSDEEIKKYHLTLCKGKIRDFKLPWENFVKDVKDALQSCIISYKESKPIVTKPYNKYEKWVIENGKAIKKIFKQEIDGGGKWMAVRRSMFKQPLGIIWLKQIKAVEIKDALKIQAQWNEIKNDPQLKKNKPYVYDDYAQKYLDAVVEQLNLSPKNFTKKKNEIDKWIESISEKVNTGITDKNGKTKTKTLYNLDGKIYEKIEIAEFVQYKTKRMKISPENLKSYSIEKMIKNIPYFEFISEEQFNEFNEEQQEIIKNAGINIGNKKMSPINFVLLLHIVKYRNNPKEAFNNEGIENLNELAIQKIGKSIKCITRLDGEVNNQEIFRNAIYETDKGANIYFIMYENIKSKQREYLSPSPSISVLKAIEKKNKMKDIAPEKEGFKRIVLSPGDLVYVPTIDEIEEIKKNNTSIEDLLKNKAMKDINERIYQVRKFTGDACYFIKYNIAELILSYSEVDNKKIGELGSQNLSEYTMDDDEIPIKKHCIKIKINRLGEIQIIY